MPAPSFAGAAPAGAILGTDEWINYVNAGDIAAEMEQIFHPSSARLGRQLRPQRHEGRAEYCSEVLICDYQT